MFNLEWATFILLRCRNCEYQSKKVPGIRETNCQNCQSTLLYQCLNCNQSYGLYQNIITHLRTKCINVLQYRCSYCDYSTPFKHHLLTHLSSNHGGFWFTIKHLIFKKVEDWIIKDNIIKIGKKLNFWGEKSYRTLTCSASSNVCNQFHMYLLKLSMKLLRMV